MELESPDGKGSRVEKSAGVLCAGWATLRLVKDEPGTGFPPREIGAGETGFPPHPGCGFPNHGAR